MKFIYLVLIQFLFYTFIFAQGPTPADWNLTELALFDPKLGNVNVYVTKEGISEEKPMLFIPLGCSGIPITLVIKSEEKSVQIGTFPPDQIKSFSEKFHVVLIGQAGTPFCDTTEVDVFNPYKNLEEYKPNKEYIQRCGIEWPVDAAKLVFDTLKKILPIKNEIIVAMGYSEGGRIVSRLANECKDITHLVCIASGGLNQFYSSIINLRLDAISGNLTQEEAQQKIDTLFSIYEKIYKNPNSTEDWYYGHPYKRWGSFCNDIPLEHLLKLDIPILIVQGTTDRSSPVLQSDYVKLEFIRHRKTNLTCHVIPGCDHQLYQAVEENGETKHISKRNEAFNYVADWIINN